MLNSYEAIYHQGQLRWLDPLPSEPNQDQRVRVFLEIDPLPTVHSPRLKIASGADTLLLDQYQSQLTAEQIALLSKLMGAWSLADSACTHPYDYPE